MSNEISPLRISSNGTNGPILVCPCLLPDFLMGQMDNTIYGSPIVPNPKSCVPAERLNAVNIGEDI
jgi:hypothetical protein